MLQSHKSKAETAELIMKIFMHRKTVLLLFVVSGLFIASLAQSPRKNSKKPLAIPPKTVVLTFDDSVKSHVQIVAPLLKELGFNATFFITQRWMNDTEDFLTWDEVAQIHRMGFEIGNHSWTHGDFGVAENGAKLGEELEKVEKALAQVGIPKPKSFAWCGNTFGPEAIGELRKRGYALARRGMQPELPYGKVQLGPSLDVSKHHPLLIPTTGDAYPGWTMEHFQRVIKSAKRNEIVVLQFHGVPDRKHPWVHTPPEAFRDYMHYLKQKGYRVIAMRDLLPLYGGASGLPSDPLLQTRLTHESPSFKR
jgi:peptidoglycan/xylan/chitin deacetylase (PgdA/CDA1 family)